MSFNFSYRNTYDNIEISLYCCGREQCEKSHYYGPALRSSYLVHIILSGKGIYKINNREYFLKKGDIFLIYPDELIYYEADSDDPWEYMWVGFIGTKVEDYLNNTAFSKTNPVTHLPNESNLINSINNIISATKITSNKNLKILSTLYEFFYTLLEEVPNPLESKKYNQKNYMDEALLYIQLNFLDNISVADIAKHLCIDRSYLHRLFKKYVNLSPQEYIQSLKFEKAAYLLSSTNLRISDISRSIGYTDPLLFSKTFKKIKKYTPSEYRKINL